MNNSVLRWTLSILTTAAFLLPSAVLAGDDKFAGAFMDTGAGARALGMGGTFTAVADDASATYWNPAGISGLPQREILLMHSERFGGLLKYNYGSFTMPTGLSISGEGEAAFGFSIIHLGADDIPITLQLPFQDNNGIPGFQPGTSDRLDTSQVPTEASNDFAFLVTYAFKSKVGRIGANVKFIYIDQVTGESATGIGFDLAWLYRDLFKNFNLGVNLQNITGTYLSWSTGRSEIVDPTLRVGAAYQLTSHTLKGGLLLTADGHFFFDNRQNAAQYWQGSTGVDTHLGAEINFQKKVMLRGGLDSGNPTAGAGFRVGPLGFDYAYLQVDEFEATHRISGQVTF